MQGAAPPLADASQAAPDGLGPHRDVFLRAPPDAAPPCPPDDAVCAAQVVFDLPVPDAPVVAYVGGSNWDPGFAIDDANRTGHLDMLLVGFVNYWAARWQPGQCGGPAEAPLDSLPILQTNACAQTGPTWLQPPAEWAGCILAQCRGGGEGTVGDAVLRYQESGGRVLVSVGGARSNAVEIGPETGRALARALWNMFLGGTDRRYVGWRPFGPQVVLDGVDLDLEQSPANCPDAIACRNVQAGWHAFVVTLRALMDADRRKRYLITAAPINTKYADPGAGGFDGFGSFTYGFLPGVAPCLDGWDAPDEARLAAIAAQPERSVFAALEHVDFVWPQFYPSPSSITLNGRCWEQDLLAWTQMCALSGENPRCRVGIGLPWALQAAQGGQISVERVVQGIVGALQRRPVLRRHFGGVMGWDELWDAQENDGDYGRLLSAALRDRQIRDLLE